MTEYRIDLPVTAIKVAGYDFQVEYWNAHNATAMGRYGECSTIEQTIRFQRVMSSRFKAADTVLHEISHAIHWAYGVQDEDKEERVVCAFAAGWMQVYRDNPWLLTWLSEALYVQPTL